MAEDRQHAETGPAPATDAPARAAGPPAGPEAEPHTRPQAEPHAGPEAELGALFDRTESLAARPRSVTELPGGLTNRNYKVTTPAGTFVARVSGAGGDLLAIDRDAEYRNSVAAAAAGAGAQIGRAHV